MELVGMTDGVVWCDVISWATFVCMYSTMFFDTIRRDKI